MEQETPISLPIINRVQLQRYTFADGQKVEIESKDDVKYK